MSSSVDTADSSSCFVSNSDESFLSPVGSPRVLDDPVALAIAYSEDTVISLGSTSTADDTTVVVLESGLVGLNRDGNWALGDSSLELCVVVGGNIEYLPGLDDTLSSVVPAV